MATKAKLYHGVHNEEFNPTDYTYCDSVYLEDTMPAPLVEHARMWAIRIGRDSKTSLEMRRCSHCGAHLRYIHILHHGPTGDYLSVGHDCIERFTYATRKAVLEAHTRLKYDAADGRKRTKAQAFREDNPGLIEGIVEVLACVNDRFMSSLLEQFEEKGTLSEKQVAAGFRTIAKLKDRIEQNHNIVAAGQAAPVERRYIEGKIRKLTPLLDDYGEEYGLRTILDVDATTPYRVMMNVPANLRNNPELAEGLRIGVTITLKELSHKPDPLFRFGSRPYGAKICK